LEKTTMTMIMRTPTGVTSVRRSVWWDDVAINDALDFTQRQPLLTSL
jgi:hypothetical protein